MVRQDWVLGGDRRSAARERIYAAAAEIVLNDGLDAFDIDTLARRTHCSRATVYRYAGGKAQIREAALLRIAADITGTVRREVEGLCGPERVVRAIAVALRQIRSDPIRRLMGAGRVSGLADLHASPVLQAMAAELTGLTDDDHTAALWIVHVVLSLAYLPIGDEDIEVLVLQRFVAPAFDRPPGPDRGRE